MTWVISGFFYFIIHCYFFNHIMKLVWLIDPFRSIIRILNFSFFFKNTGSNRNMARATVLGLLESFVLFFFNLTFFFHFRPLIFG